MGQPSPMNHRPLQPSPLLSAPTATHPRPSQIHPRRSTSSTTPAARSTSWQSLTQSRNGNVRHIRADLPSSRCRPFSAPQPHSQLLRFLSSFSSASASASLSPSSFAEMDESHRSADSSSPASNLGTRSTPIARWSDFRSARREEGDEAQ